MSPITDALDRMDFWSRELALGLLRDREPLEPREERMRTVIAVSQFQAAQEAAWIRRVIP